MSASGFRIFPLAMPQFGGVMALFKPWLRREANALPRNRCQSSSCLARAGDLVSAQDLNNYPFAEESHFFGHILEELGKMREPELDFGLAEKIQPVLTFLQLRIRYTCAAAAVDKSGENNFVVTIFSILDLATQQGESHFFLPDAIEKSFNLIQERLGSSAKAWPGLSSVGELRIESMVGHLVAYYRSVYPRIRFVARVDFRDTILVQRLRWFSLLDNVVRNSIASIGGPGTIRIAIRSEAEPGSERLVLEVCDSGAGMSPEHLAHVTSKPREGRGLWIIRQVVRLNRGTALIESTPGGGTRFVATFDMQRIMKVK